VDTLSGSRARDGGGGAVEVEVTDDGKEPGTGIPADVDVDAGAVSRTTPPSRQSEPAKHLRGVKT
jgi:hypothetical protein